MIRIGSVTCAEANNLSVHSVQPLSPLRRELRLEGSEWWLYRYVNRGILMIIIVVSARVDYVVNIRPCSLCVSFTGLYKPFRPYHTATQQSPITPVGGGGGEGRATEQRSGGIRTHSRPHTEYCADLWVVALSNVTRVSDKCKNLQNTQTLTILRNH